MLVSSLAVTEEKAHLFIFLRQVFSQDRMWSLRDEVRWEASGWGLWNGVGGGLWSRLDVRIHPQNYLYWIVSGWMVPDRTKTSWSEYSLSTHCLWQRTPWEAMAINHGDNMCQMFNFKLQEWNWKFAVYEKSYSTNFVDKDW